MSLPPLVQVITANTDGLERGLNVARRGIVAMAAAAGAAAGAATVALTAMTQRGLAAVDALAKMSRSMDATSGGLRAVQIAARYAGLSVEETNTSLQSMNRELARAEDVGTPAARALRQIGLRAGDLAGLDADSRVALIADRIRDMGLSAGQASALLRDLGVRSRNMALLMIQGGDAIRSARQEVREFGLELSQEQIAAVEAANDAVARLSLVFEGLRNRLAASVAPALRAASERMAELARSEHVRVAIERLSEAFGRLAQTVLSDEFVSAAAGALEGLASGAAVAADGMVFLANNTELVTGALTALTLAWMGLARTPLGMALTVAAGAATALSIALNRSAAPAARTTEQAHAELNRVLGVFNQTGSPTAQREAVRLAEALYGQARAAVIAAEGLREMQRARLDAIAGFGTDEGPQTNPMVARVQAELDAADAALTTLRAQFEAEARTLAALRDQAFRGRAGVITPDEPPRDPPPVIPSLGTGGDVTSQLQSRLEALQQALMTETETVEAWYAESRDTLLQAHAQGLIDEETYRDAVERLEREHQGRMGQLRRDGAQDALRTIVGAGQNILNAIGQTNEGAMQAAKALGQFEALVNAYRAASQALADPTLPWFAKVAAAANVLAAGIGFANSIGSIGGGGRGGGGGGASAAQSAPAIPVQRLIVETQGSGAVSQQTLGSIIDQINDAGRRGYRIDLEYIGGRR
jgi:hypothetical protein